MPKSYCLIKDEDQTYTLHIMFDNEQITYLGLIPDGKSHDILKFSKGE